VSIQSLKTQNKKRKKTVLVESNMKIVSTKDENEKNENRIVKHHIFQLPKIFRTQIVNLNITIHVQIIPYNSCEKQMGD
jgi:uncharacterized protein involved in tolerance to divalent cations